MTYFLRLRASRSIGNTTNMAPPLTLFLALMTAASDTARLTIRIRILREADGFRTVGSKLKWLSATSSDQRKSKNERLSTSDKTVTEEVVGVAGFRGLPRYRIADGLLGVNVLHGPHSVLPQAPDFSQPLRGLHGVARRTPCLLKVIV